MKKGYDGLTEKEATKRLYKYGFNEIKDVGKTSLFNIFIRQIRGNFILYLLVFAMILSFFVGKNITAYVILVVVFVVVLTGFFQEYKAEKSIEKLKEMVMPVSIVLRDGVQKEIPTKEIVPGDVVILRTGDKIPADCLILSEKNLKLNEAVLTGESGEVIKSSVKNYKDPLVENNLFAGSFIVDGKCVAKVVKTGMDTKFGEIATMISGAEKELPLRNKLNIISKYMALIGVIMAALTAFVILLHTDFSRALFVDVLIISIAIAVSAFPEGFPVVLITTLSVGARRMALKNAIVNRMSIIETLGETTIICTDKTGTLTKGEMTVRKIFADNKMIEVTGSGYEGNGEFLIDGKKIDFKSKTLGLIFANSVSCNDATIRRTGVDKEFRVTGSPTEAALLIMASKANIYAEDFSERLDEIPFSSERKIMSVLCKENKKKMVYSKGALEYILEKCKYIQRDNGVYRLLERDKNNILEQKKKIAGDSYRTLGLAFKEASSNNIENEDMIFLGFVGMEDPPREGVRKALEDCVRAGIDIKMITGDDKETAKSIAKQIGLKSGKVIEGYEIEKLSEKELFKVVKQAVIFSRVKPEHKIKIVQALKEHGEIITMTGDGVNDAPALKEAHIGVAMGKNGTDVSKSVADLVLKDDNFVTLVDAIKEGRTIFNNIRKFVSYQLSCNYAELMILFVGVLLVPLFGWPIPLLVALQILLMNLVTADIPAITLGLNNSSDDVMSRKPRRNSKIINKDFLKVLIIAGMLMGLATLLMFYLSYNIFQMSVEESRTIALLTLIILEIAGAFNFRSFRKTTLNRSIFVNRYLVVAALVSLFITFLVIYTPLNKVFETVPLSPLEWIVSVALALVFILIFDLLKVLNNKKDYLKVD
jgi:P-type Ca2+ transporter type 2C